MVIKVIVDDPEIGGTYEAEQFYLLVKKIDGTYTETGAHDGDLISRAAVMVLQRAFRQIDAERG